MSKQYGLIDPKANKAAVLKTGIAKHAAFESDSDSDAGDPKKSMNLELGESQKRQVRTAQAKALAEDPTIYQYDELYDEMDNRRKESKTSKSQAERKPKYIGKLLETADKRKKEQERRIERQVQKEREAEGEMYKDKESFVTSAYRAKLEEMKDAEEKEKREEYLESIGDVTKQSDLGGFYRHIYSQKMGETVEPKKDKSEEKEEGHSSALGDEPKHVTDKQLSESESEEEKTAKLEAMKSKDLQSKARRYRKRNSDDEENDDKEEKNDSSKKVHLQSNLDADSDFSIDSNSSSSDSESNSDDGEREKNDNKKRKNKQIPSEMLMEKKPKTEDDEMPSNGVDNDTKSANENKEEVSKVVTEQSVKEVKKPKEPKIDIWKKRTIGPVLDAALQRYYERKAARESG
ncbi:nuclear speckle splicing regulatory protein 1 [Armigeres subalbatus]|uniref:nuclear speckle splicing regulatory protein 1 n=1 Tax=Armigeres subalbatus TaxID=124917 RepID=UPI002ED07209